MYNFLLVIRVLIANRFCYTCDKQAKELGYGGRGAGENKPYQ